MDSSPRTVPVEFATTTTATEQAGGGVTGTLYYVVEGSLVPAATSLKDSDISTLVDALLKAPPEKFADANAMTSIPAGTKLNHATISGNVLEVDLSSDFDNVVGVSRQQAIAQIVLTVTERIEIRSVEFAIDGESIQVSSPTRGDVSRVAACDFKDLLATTDQALSALLPSESVELVTNRRNRLSLLC